MKNWFRINEWWNSKIVALTGLAYFFAIEEQQSFDTFYPILLFLFVWMVLSAAIGYYINDIFDLKQDLEVQKENQSKGHRLSQKIILPILLVAGIVLVWYFLNGSKLILTLIISQLLLFFLYSTPYIRLKEKPLVGIFVDALYAHLIPGLVVLICFLGVKYKPIIYVLFTVWQLAVGVRNILAHHLVDFKNDRGSGTVTSTTLYGTDRIKKIMNFLVSPFEFIAFISLLAFLNSPLFWIIPIYILYVLYVFNRELIFLRQNKSTWSSELQNSYNFIGGVILNEFYEKWLPIIALGILCFMNPFFLILALIHSILFYKNILVFKKDYMILKNIILSQIYWWLVKNFYAYFLNPVYYKFFGTIKHFIYWKIHEPTNDKNEPEQ